MDHQGTFAVGVKKQAIQKKKTCCSFRNHVTEPVTLSYGYIPTHTEWQNILVGCERLHQTPLLDPASLTHTTCVSLCFTGSALCQGLRSGTSSQRKQPPPSLLLLTLTAHIVILLLLLLMPPLQRWRSERKSRLVPPVAQASDGKRVFAPANLCVKAQTGASSC